MAPLPCDQSDHSDDEQQCCVHLDGMASDVAAFLVDAPREAGRCPGTGTPGQASRLPTGQAGEGGRGSGIEGGQQVACATGNRSGDQGGGCSEPGVDPTPDDQDVAGVGEGIGARPDHRGQAADRETDDGCGEERDPTGPWCNRRHCPVPLPTTARRRRPTRPNGGGTEQ